MIAVDANVLLRYILQDDIEQADRASKLIKKHSVILITDVALVETVWILKGRRYSFTKQSICNVLHGLLGDSSFVFENNQVIWSALRDYEESKPIEKKELDFADALICNKSYLVAKNKDASLVGFYSFDKAVAQLKGVKKL